ncbi:hypothetical protein L6R50_18890 [Myxococcota bacterium]|nr:hypothetical protein [Myxococcota bacterium]
MDRHARGMLLAGVLALSGPGATALAEEDGAVAAPSGIGGGSDGASFDREWLGVAALLVLWLLTRTSQRRAAIPAHGPAHRGAVTPDEVGRAVFAAARSDDFDAYRAQYLGGAEATRVLGRERAEAYLDGRPPERIRLAFARLGHAIDPETVYDCVESDAGGLWSLRLKRQGDVRLTVPLGTLHRVGGLWRLLDPPDGGGMTEEAPGAEDGLPTLDTGRYAPFGDEPRR